MATNNQLNNSLSGVSGGSSGALVGTNSPTLVTSDFDVASATSLDFGSSSTTGIVATTTNNNAATGYVGEFVESSIVEGSAVSLTTAVPKDVTSISLGAGDWDVSGVVFFKAGATTTSTSQQMSVSSTSNTIETGDAFCSRYQNMSGNDQVTASNSSTRFSLSGTSTIYLVAVSFFLVSTMDAYGYISARRVR